MVHCLKLKERNGYNSHSDWAERLRIDRMEKTNGPTRYCWSPRRVVSSWRGVTSWAVIYSHSQVVESWLVLKKTICRSYSEFQERRSWREKYPGRFGELYNSLVSLLFSSLQNKRVRKRESERDQTREREIESS